MNLVLNKAEKIVDNEVVATYPTIFIRGNKGNQCRAYKKGCRCYQKARWKGYIYVCVLGEHDLVFTLDFPDMEKALATSVALNELTGISFTTSPVVEVEKFDKLVAEAKDI